jgi:hypothetical protein
MRRWTPILALMLVAVLTRGATAQSQADRTGQGSAMVAAGQESVPLVFHPITIGAVVAGVIGLALVVATEDDSPVATITATSTTQ